MYGGVSLGREGLEKQGWGSVAGQPALAFDNTGCERAVLGMSPPLAGPEYPFSKVGSYVAFPGNCSG